MSLFALDWDAPVPDSERDEILAKLADGVRKRGLQMPAVLFLEIHKPLAPLGAQLAILFSPFIGILFVGGAFDMQKYTKLMRSTDNIDRLIALIEATEPRSAVPQLESPIST